MKEHTLPAGASLWYVASELDGLSSIKQYSWTKTCINKAANKVKQLECFEFLRLGRFDFTF